MLVVDIMSDTAVQENFRDCCAIVEDGGRALLIERVGKPEIIMLSMADYRAMTNHEIRAVGESSKKMRAYEAMEAMKKSSPFPKDYDYETVREEAFTEKYGRFD